MPLQTTPDAPAAVRTVARLLGDWIGKLGEIWVEGQVTQITRRAGAQTAFLTLRDSAADISLPVTCSRGVLDAVEPPLAQGARVVVLCRPSFYVARGSLSLSAREIRPVGLGALLARLEQVRSVLAAEGLFAAERKRPLPFLPGVVGVVCGRGSAAERDVLENTRRRWPAVRFTVREVAVQGPYAVTEVGGAVRELDRDPEVDVIVVTRGGGSVEDLLPFSDEGLIRVVAACTTPVVSAIGHEQDAPLLDLVADVRASTPTDAAKQIVPDVAEEFARVARARDQARRALAAMLRREQTALDAIRSRPVIADPARVLDDHRAAVFTLADRARRTVDHLLDRAVDDLAHTRARVTALSPAATLRRGYAVVQRVDGEVVRAPTQVAAGERLGVRLADDRLAVVVAEDS